MEFKKQMNKLRKKETNNKQNRLLTRERTLVFARGEGVGGG